MSIGEDFSSSFKSPQILYTWKKLETHFSYTVSLKIYPTDHWCHVSDI
jgi:hypothetical protein